VRERALAFSIVVVVSFESDQELGDLLRSLRRWLDTPYELIVVDNGSRSRRHVVERAFGGGARVLELEGNPGYGAAVNAGLRVAEHDVVLVMNADMVLLDDSLAALADLARETGAIVGPELVSPDGSRQPSALPRPAGWELAVAALVPQPLMPAALLRRCEPWRRERRAEVGWLLGACFAARRDLLLEIGPFDERIHMFGEDIDLAIRARERGVPSVFAPDVARVVHVGGRATEGHYDGPALELKTAQRQWVVRERLGWVAAVYDTAALVVYLVRRWAGARLGLGGGAEEETAWLAAYARRLLRSG
jgi:N-acetylglucosaminyl-diphospho-decaprenol L-rhamnosyltransferase